MLIADRAVTAARQTTGERIEMNATKRIIAAGLLALATLAMPASLSYTAGASGPELHLTSVPSAHAVQNNGTNGAKTRKQLEDDGYTCTYHAISGGIYECTKKGAKTWTCNKYGEDCGESPLRRVPNDRTLPPGGAVLTTSP
jgi:hypothetical protein